MNTMPAPNHFNQFRQGSLQSDTSDRSSVASAPSTDTLLALQLLHRAGPHVGPSGHSQESSRRSLPITLWLRSQTGRVPTGEDSATVQALRHACQALLCRSFKSKILFQGPSAQDPNLKINQVSPCVIRKRGPAGKKLSRGPPLYHAEFAACSQADCSRFPSFFTIMFQGEVRTHRQSI